MRFIIGLTKRRFLSHLLIGWLAVLSLSHSANAWWDKEWAIRKKITVDTASATINDPVGSPVVLVRLHDGNFQFAAAKEDGGDIRFVAEDDKTLLPFHIEKFDALLNEAFVWVKAPELKPGAQTSFWLYYGNSGEKVTHAGDAKATYDADTSLVYHLGERNQPPRDSTSNGTSAENAGLAVEGSLIGSGLRFDGKNTVSIPASSSLAWNEGGSLTWSAWVKLTTLQPSAILFSRRENSNALGIGFSNGIPFVEITNAGGTQRSEAGTAPLAANTWHHLAVVSTGASTTLYLDGQLLATLNAGLPALNSPMTLGGDTAEGAVGFIGELDELQLAKAARSAGSLKLAAVNQSGGEPATKLLGMAQDEVGHSGENEIIKHLSLISDISKSLTFDGWVVIFLCTILAVVGWVITVKKFFYLNRIKKATTAFLQHWKHLSKDLTVLDHGDEQNIKSMGGKVSSSAQKVINQSPLYHIYKLGSGEIHHRVTNAKGGGFKGLSGRSMQAIRATLDGGLVREVQRLNSNIVFLTIGIAGGPYLGLLGTVIGVMITFAVIAKSGEVEVNSIAPGIAGALLATVAGLAVAIPALFAYSYISSRIKDAVSEMQLFIDEFVAKIAEFYSGND